MFHKVKFFKFIWVWLLAIIFSFAISSAAAANGESVAGIEDLTTLDFTVAKTTDGQTTTYRFRYKDIETPEEAVRVNMTEPDGSILIIILDKEDNKVLVKDVDETTWQSYPGMTLPTMWEKWVRPYMALPGRRSTTWAQIEGQEFQVEGEGRILELYDIKVDEPIEESVFNPG